MPKGGIVPFRGTANLPESVLRHMGYRSDNIAISRYMGPPRPKTLATNWSFFGNDEVDLIRLLLVKSPLLRGFQVFKVLQGMGFTKMSGRNEGDFRGS